MINITVNTDLGSEYDYKINVPVSSLPEFVAIYKEKHNNWSSMVIVLVKDKSAS